METPKARNGSTEATKKVSPRVARQLKVPVAFGSSSPASPSTTTATRTPKDKSPKVPERKSPRSSAVPEKKRLSKLAELESRISELQDDLKKAKDQLIASKKSKEEAEANIEAIRQQLATVSSKLEDSEKRFSDLSTLKDAHVSELKSVSDEKDRVLDEVEALKQQLETVTRHENTENESTSIENRNLKENLRETLFVLESVKTEVEVYKQSEAKAQEIVRETLARLEQANETVNALRRDGMELENSRARVFYLEGVISELNAQLAESVENSCRDSPGEDVTNLRTELRNLKSALEAADFRHRDEQEQSSARIEKARELADQIASDSCLKLAELELELARANSDIDELKANLLRKESVILQVLDENNSLKSKLDKSISGGQKNDGIESLKKELATLKEVVREKETELRTIAKQNESLKSELGSKREEEAEKEYSTRVELEAMTEVAMTEEAVYDYKTSLHAGIETLKKELSTLKESVREKETELRAIANQNESLKSELENKREEEAEREYSTRVELEAVTEEAEKSRRRAERASEQLEAAQTGNAELEAELRKLKVQSDQWRKAAEAAASMLATPGGGNGRFVERTGSLDSNGNGYGPVAGQMGSPYMDEFDDDEAFKKKNGNVLRKIGGFWKKPQK